MTKPHSDVDLSDLLVILQTLQERSFQSNTIDVEF